jgi:hypothetical protein
VTQSCRNCDSTIYDDDPFCYYCDSAHERLLERLRSRDDNAATIAAVASWAIYERVPKWKAAWRVRLGA